MLLERGEAAAAISHLLYTLATAYVMNQELENAERVLADAVTGEPENSEFRMAYGRVLRYQHSTRKLRRLSAQWLKRPRLTSRRGANSLACGS
jgi:cytochrome c-type biogenesis protein CcmH/NrfG